MSAVLARPGFLGEVRRGDLATKRMRTQSSVGFGETYLQVQEFGQSYVLYSCWSKGNVGTHFEKTRGARIRSRFRSISAHDEQKKTQAHVNWTLCEDPENPTFVLTHTNEEAQVFVHDLNFFVTVQLLEDALAVLSLGKLCIDHGYSYEWVSGHKPRLTKEGKTIVCKTDTFVGLVVPGLFTSSGSNSSSTPGIVNKISPWAKWRTSPTKVVRIILKRSQSRDADDRLRDLPEWLEEFTDNLEDTEVPAPAHNFSGLRFGTSYESDIKIKEAQHLYSLPKRPKLRCLLSNQNDKGSLQKTHWRSSTSDKKVWWLDGGWWPRRWVPKAEAGQQQADSRGSQTCVCANTLVTGVAYARERRANWRPAVVLFSRRGEHLQWDAQEIVHAAFHWRPKHSSSPLHRSETSGIAEKAVRRVKVVRFYRMLLLLLSAKRPRPPGRWENAVRNTIWRTIQRDNNTFSEQWLNIIRFRQEINQDFFNLARKDYQ